MNCDVCFLVLREGVTFDPHRTAFTLLLHFVFPSSLLLVLRYVFPASCYPCVLLSIPCSLSLVVFLLRSLQADFVPVY